MALRREEHDDHEHGHAPARTTAAHMPFGVAQILAIALGIFFIVIGAVGLARTGLGSLTEPTVEVIGIGMTPLLALIHLLIGFISVAGAATRAAARGAMLFLGPLLIAAGIIALMQEVEGLGWNSVNGFTYLISGAAAIIAAIVTPLGVDERTTVA